MAARRYTDDQFREAVADPDVRTIADLCRALGIVPRGGNYRTLRTVASRLGVQLPRTDQRPGNAARPPRSRPRWTDEQLLAALDDPTVDGYPALCARLGLRPYSETYRRLRERASLLGRPLPASWSRTGPRPGSGPAYRGRERRLPFDPEALATAVAMARTKREVLELLGAEVNDTNYGRLARQLRHVHLDTGHLSAPAYRRVPLEELLVAGRNVTTSGLRRRLIDEGVLAPVCARCRRTTWEDATIPLELDHIDGDPTDNRLDNLRLLCPNCHALTDTYRGRNIGRGAGRRTTA